MWVSGLPFKPFSRSAFSQDVAAPLTVVLDWQTNQLCRKGSQTHHHWDKTLNRLSLQKALFSNPTNCCVYTGDMSACVSSHVLHKASISIHRRQRLIGGRSSFYSMPHNETLLSAGGKLDQEWNSNMSLTFRWEPNVSEEALALIASHAHKLLFLFMQLLYSEKIPDKTAIAGCELDEGKYHV